MLAFVRNRLDGAYEVDPWGLDLALVHALSPLFGLRYGIEVDRPELLPAEGPALLVANRRFGVSEPIVLARGVRLATGRVVRTVGAPDVAPVGSALRRLGAVLARPDEVAGLLRAGEVVGVFLGHDVRPRLRAGALPAALVTPAFELDVPVVPVALVGRELGRSWRVRLGPPVAHRKGRSPLALTAMAERTQGAVQELLDEALAPRGFL